MNEVGRVSESTSRGAANSKIGLEEMQRTMDQMVASTDTVTDRLALTARSAMIDVVTILLGFCVGASTNAQYFLRPQSILIFGLGALAFAIATACGVLFAKLMNVFLKDKINPLVGAAGVSAVPDSARVVQMVGQEEDPSNFLLMHAMAPNVAGVIGSAIAAGVLWSQLSS